MPTVTFNLTELKSLVGPVDTHALVDAIAQLKGEVKLLKGDELTVELEPDRPDILSVEGLARALKGYLELETGLPSYVPSKISESGLEVRVKDAKLRPYIACAVVKELRLTSELVKNFMKMQEILHLTLGRNRRKVAIGFHDLSAIRPPIIYTDTSPDDRIVPLDMPQELTLREVLRKHPKGLEYGHLVSNRCPVYVDRNGIFSFPPVINSERTRVTEQTEELFVELTGVDPVAIRQTLNIIVANLLDRGGVVESVKIIYDNRVETTPDFTPRRIKVSLSEISKIIGVSFDEKLAEQLLAKMRYGIGEMRSGEVEVIVPPYRADVMHPVDIAEDFAIAYGYKNLKPELPNIHTTGKPSLIELFESKLRSCLIGLGFQEVITFCLSSRKLQAELMGLDDNYVLLDIENPVAETLSVYRRWILPHLLEVFSQNKHVSYPQKIFEIGYVASPEGRIDILRNTAVAIASAKTAFSEIQGVLQSLANSLGINYRLKKCSHPSFIAGRAALILVRDEPIGIIGEIHPRVICNFELEVPVTALELSHCRPAYPNSKEKPKLVRDGIKSTWLPGFSI